MSDVDVLTPEKRRLIVAGASQAFAAAGYGSASMSQIATFAGVSKGTLYNYFESKAALFIVLIEEACEEHLLPVFDIASPDGDPASVLQAIGERMLRMMISPTPRMLHRLVVAEAATFPELARAFYEAGPVRAYGFMAQWLSRQVAGGRLVVDDPAFAAEQFFALCQTRIGMQCRLGLLPDPTDAEVKRVVRLAVAMFLKTYGVHP